MNLVHQLRKTAKHASAKSADWISALPAKSAIVRATGLRIRTQAMNCSISASMIHSIHYHDKELELIILWHPLELEGRIFNCAEPLPKRNRTVRSTKRYLFLIWHTANLMDRFYRQAGKSIDPGENS